jgi:branched-chain amino acid transport system permease protein
MVIFSVILMAVIIFARRGIMGRNEFSWDALFRRLRLSGR